MAKLFESKWGFLQKAIIMFNIYRCIILKIIGCVLVVSTATGAQALQSCNSINTPLISCPSDCFSSYGINNGGWFYDVMDSATGQKLDSGGSCSQVSTRHIIQKSVDCMKSNGVQRIRHEACHCWKCR